MIRPILGGYKRATFAAAEYAMTVDGNSIMDPAYSDMVTQLQALSPISNQITINNFAISGQSVQQMTANHSDVDAAFVTGKINYLLVFEITNNIYNDGRTGLQTIADLTAYIAAVKAVHPGWRVILMTGIPRGSLFGSTWNVVTGEEQMEIANSHVRSDYVSMGAYGFIESREPGGPFDFTDCADAANFPSQWWTDRTHPSNGTDGGKGFLARTVARYFSRLPAR